MKVTLPLKTKDQLEYIKQLKHYRSVKETLELAIKESYKEIDFLEKFMWLNHSINDQILKEYHEYANDIETEREKLKEILLAGIFQNSSESLKELKHKLQDLFEVHFSEKYKSVAKTALEAYISTAYFTDFQVLVFKVIIISIILLIFICFLISYHYNIDMDSDSEFKSIFPMFRAFFCLCLYFWFLGIDVFVWNKAKINYKLVFQFTNHYSDVLSVFKRAGTFSAVFVLMYLFYMILRTNIPYFSGMISFIPLQMTPLICWAILVIYTFCPFKGLFNYQGR
jgi:hypothetical protein